MKTKKDKRFSKILFNQKQIEKKIKELANWVNKEYKDSKDLIIIGLLKGSLPFLAQLIKDVEVEHSIDFMVVSSYNGAYESSGNIKISLSNLDKKFKFNIKWNIIFNQGEVAQLGRALGLGPSGRRFKSCLLHHFRGGSSLG